MPKSALAPSPTLHDEVAAALKRLQAKNPGLKRMLKQAHGYAVFPSVGKASVVVGGSYGRGEVYEKGEVIGYATLSQLTLGVQLGGDTFSEILLFDSPQALDRFKRGKTSFAANASAVLVKAGAQGTKSPEKGVTAFAYSRGGMLLELAIGGQKFKFKPIDEEDGGGGEGQGQEEGQEQESGAGATGLAGRAMGGIRAAGSMVKEHPVAATLIGVGVAAGVGLLVARKLRTGASTDGQDEGQEEGQKDEEERPDEEMSADDDEEGQEDDEEGQGGEDDQDNTEAEGSAEDEGDDAEEDEDEGRQNAQSQRRPMGGVLNRILGRRRTRA